MIDAKAAGAVLGLSPRKVYELAHSGDLACHRVGRKVLFTVEAIEKYKQKCRVSPKPDTRIDIQNAHIANALADSESALAKQFAPLKKLLP